MSGDSSCVADGVTTMIRGLHASERYKQTCGHVPGSSHAFAVLTAEYCLCTGPAKAWHPAGGGTAVGKPGAILNPPQNSGLQAAAAFRVCDPGSRRALRPA